MKRSDQLRLQKTNRVYASYAAGGAVFPSKLVPIKSARPVRWGLVISLASMLSLVMVPFLLLSSAFFYYRSSGRLFPGITSGPVAVGGLTMEEAEAQITSYWNLQYGLTASDGVHDWVVPPSLLGLKVDEEATAAWAYRVARGENGLDEMLDIAYNGSWAVNPVIVFTPEAARAGLEQIAADAARDGVVLDIDATIQGISAAPEQIFLSGKITLATVPQKPEKRAPASDPKRMESN